MSLQTIMSSSRPKVLALRSKMFFKILMCTEVWLLETDFIMAHCIHQYINPLMSLLLNVLLEGEAWSDEADYWWYDLKVCSPWLLAPPHSILASCHVVNSFL